MVFLLALRSPHGTWERPEYIKLTVRLAGDSSFRVELLEFRGAGDRQWEAQPAGGSWFMRQATDASPGSVRGHCYETTVPLEKWCSVVPQEATVLQEYRSGGTIGVT